MVTLDSSIQRVTLYSDRAQIFRTTSLKSKVGAVEYLFDNLPVGIDPNSVQVKGTGISILNIQVLDSEKKISLSNEIQTLLKELKSTDKKCEELLHKIKRIEEEQNFIHGIREKLTNETASLNDQDFNPDNWKKMLELHKTQITQTDGALKECREELIRQNELKATILTTLIEHKISPEGKSLDGSKNKKQVKITGDVETDGDVQLMLSYILTNASWSARYDLRVNSDENTLTLSYLGIIQQNTGEDWENVELKLSTARPSLSGNPPALSTWYIRKQIFEDYDEMPKSMPGGGALKSKGASLDKMMKEEEVKKTLSTVKSGANSVTYDIANACSAKSGEADIRTIILHKTISCEFLYQIVPASSTFAFLSVKFTNDTEYPLLAGLANIFVDGNFTAKINFKQLIPGDSTNISLGADEGIKVEYLHLKTYEKKEGLFQKRSKLIDESKTSIQNLKKQEFQFTVTEQIPLSENQEIQVELLQPGSQEKYEVTKTDQNFVIRKFKLKAGEKIDLPLVFSVDYPQNMQVEGLPYTTE